MESIDSTRDLEALYTLAYDELRRLARSALRREVHATLSPTTLVHEAWLKLRRSGGVYAESPMHFKRIAARAMRQVLVEAARRRHAAKRGDGIALVTFDEALHPSDAGGEELLALDAALGRLGELYPRQAELIEIRYFAGLSVPETAESMGISEATVHRDWRAARAWLAVELGRAG